MNIFRDHQVKRHIVKLFLDRGLTIAANMGYFARKSPSWASVPRRKAVPSCVAFAFSGFSSEEKGTDVNLASHLLMDGFCDFYECAIVVSGDSDLVTPVEMVRDTIKEIV